MNEQAKWSVAALGEAFGKHLRDCCGASAATCCEYFRHARNFLRGKYGDGPVDLKDIRPVDLVTFVSDCSTHYKPRSCQAVATALRSFLRFLQLNGLCGSRLIDAVPTIACWRLADLPAVLSDEQLTKLLASFDRSTAIGMRDYAMAVCMVVLGLRAAEVSRLSLDDIDWRAGILRLQAEKTRRTRTMPLPDQIGRAIVAYIRNGRPQTPHRSVFVCHKRAVGAPIKRGSVSAAIHRALKRSGIHVPSKRSHVLRHTAATRLIRRGATLKEIADLLGHRSLDATAIYVKVDLETLSEVAMPWPEVSK